MKTAFAYLSLLMAASSFLWGEEKTVVSLKDYCTTEVKSAGLEIKLPVTVHIKALGGGGDYGWSHRTDKMFAYGWIINADTRDLVWKMDGANTTRRGTDRQFDGEVRLDPGTYEIYFAVYSFVYHSTFTHVERNIDRRRDLLFGQEDEKGSFMKWLKGWWSKDVQKDWSERCKEWGIEVLVDQSVFSGISTFRAPKELPNRVVSAVGLGDNAFVRQGFTVSEPTTVRIYALGEASGDEELVDWSWIVNANTRERLWEMNPHDVTQAGGAEKNVRADGSLRLDPGKYVMYAVTDDSHSPDDWNAELPYDPYGWGISVFVMSEKDRKNIKPYAYTEIENVIVRITQVGDDQQLVQGFTLRQATPIRIYAIGEESLARRQMMDYGVILDARERNKVWSMDVDKTYPAGGSTKNRYVDEVLTLPKGSYLVSYTTDDSHSYNEWNQDPPLDMENYGITVMGAGANFSKSAVSTFVEQRDRNIIAQIVKVGDDADRTEKFSLDKTTRVRIYAIGEGQNRQMYDYGWIENARTGAIVWEMTYAMTLHAGGARKNRSVNTTVLLEKGEYRLRFRSDDSHSYGDWNMDPPENQQDWGITLYRDEVVEVPPPPHAPPEPLPPPVTPKVR